MPRALSRAAKLQPLLRPIVGERGRWLSRQLGLTRALEESDTEQLLPTDPEQRWAEGAAAERRALLTLVRRLAPERARALVAEGWTQEKVDQRLAWLTILESHLSADDEPLLSGMLSDRSSQVRVTAARLLWRIPESEVARRMRERVSGLLEVTAAAKGIGKLWSGGRVERRLHVTLPPETYEPAWEKEGIVETPTGSVGRRQFWLAQMIACVSPAHWTERWSLAPQDLVALLEGHELGDVLLDGLTSAALRHDARDFFPTLWDAWARLDEDQTEGRRHYRAQLSDHPLSELLTRMNAVDAEPRLLRVLDDPRKVHLLSSVPGPWPHALSRRLVAGLSELRPDWTELLPSAALAIPVELMPPHVNTPALANEADYRARAYLRALERFQVIAALRTSIAREIAS